MVWGRFSQRVGFSAAIVIALAGGGCSLKSKLLKSNLAPVQEVGQLTESAVQAGSSNSGRNLASAFSVFYGPFCSLDSFATIEACVNPQLPEPPAINREMRQPFADLDWGSSYRDFSTPLHGFPSSGKYPEVSASPNKTIIYPFARPTLDARILFFTPNYGNSKPLVADGDPPAIAVFRPEAMGDDFTGKNISPQSPPMFVHPIVYNTPLDGETRMDDASFGYHVGFGSPKTFHLEVCHESDAPNRLKEGPRVCTSSYGGSSVVGDCYDVTLLVKLEKTGSSAYELRSVPVTIFVRDAKTLQAKPYLFPRVPEGSVLPPIEAVEDPRRWGPAIVAKSLREMASACFTQPKELIQNDPKYLYCQFVLNQSWSKNGFYFNRQKDVVHQPGGSLNSGPLNFFEPSLTGDGRLLVVNSGMGFGMYYSINPEGNCRAEGWKDFYPVSRMPVDPEVYEHYDIAKKGVLFRDSFNQSITPGSVIDGGYLWLDRRGRNLFFAAQNPTRDHYSNLFKKNQLFDRGPGKGTSVIGSWTQHKLVTLDAPVNYTDFVGSNSQQVLGVYSGSSTIVHDKSSTIIFSPENYLNYYKAMMPIAPFDIVWTLTSNAQRNSEVIFDEYLKGQAVVIAHMNAPMRKLDEDDGSHYSVWFQKDGFWPQDEYKASHNLGPPLNSGANPAIQVDRSRNFQYSETPLLQNAATSSREHDPDAVPIPSSLKLLGGARVEPLGMGGVLGKGVFLDGVNDLMSIELPREFDEATSKDRSLLSDYFLSLWLDARPTFPMGPRRIVTFPDGSWIAISTQQLSLYSTATRETIVLDLAGHGLTPNRYFHLALKATTEGVDVHSAAVPQGVSARAATGVGGIAPETRGKRIGARFLRFFINGNPVLKDASAFEQQLFKTRPEKVPYVVLPLEAPQSAMKRFARAVAPFSFRSLGDRPYVLTIGASPTDGMAFQSFRGWVDELRLYQIDEHNRLPDEEVCNLALGSLLRVSGRDLQDSDLRIKKYAQLAQTTGLFSWYGWNRQVSKVCEQLVIQPASGSPPVANSFAPQRNATVCAAHTHQFPSQQMKERCLRARDYGIEDKALFADRPRPDFSEVGFCLSCHHSQALSRGLGIEALTAGSGPRESDPRRQPSNPPALLSGCAPDHASFKRPASAIQGLGTSRCSPDSILMDRIFDYQPKLSP